MDDHWNLSVALLVGDASTATITKNKELKKDWSRIFRGSVFVYARTPEYLEARNDFENVVSILPIDANISALTANIYLELYSQLQAKSFRLDHFEA